MLTLPYRASGRRFDLSALPFVSLGAYIVLSIFYVFPSGLPQPWDFMLLVVIVLTLLWSWSRVPSEPVLYIAIGVLISWIVLVNVVWFFLLGDFLFLKKMSFYLYNAIIFLFVVAIAFHDVERFKKAIWWACVIALVLQVLDLSVLKGLLTGRATGTFNNPNQLAYWAVLVMACMALARHGEPLGWMEILGLGAGFYVTLLSASRSGTASAALLIVLIAATRRCRPATGLVLGAALVLGLTFQLGIGGVFGPVESDSSAASALTRLENRWENAREQGAHSVVKRGYDRLIDHPQYLAFGAGEGAFDRLNDAGKEFHSTLGNVLMSYGVIGLALFGTLLLVVFVGAPWSAYLYMVPIMLFGVTLMGLRFSEFWIFLALVYAQGRYGGRHAPVHAPRDRPLLRVRAGPRFAGPAHASASGPAGAVDGDGGAA